MTPQPKVSQVIPVLKDCDHTWGSASAAIVLMEYGDYQCVQSGQAHHLFKRLTQQLGEQVCFVFRHFPQAHHTRSLRAAESAEAAAAQNKFWEMHDLLFKHQQQLEDCDLVQYADEIGLEMSRFLQDMAAHTHCPRIQIDIGSGRGNGVAGTPTFFIGIRQEGIEDLETLLSTLLSTTGSLEQII